MILEGFPVGPVQANCYLFGDAAAGEMFVIDPGDEAERVIAAVRRYGSRVVAIVNTHGHFDHVQAVDAVREATGAPFWIHEGEREVLEQAPRARVSSLGSIYLRLRCRRAGSPTATGCRSER